MKKILFSLLQILLLFWIARPALADDFELADEFLAGSSSLIFKIDTESEAGTGDFITLQFGESVNETLQWDFDNGRFVFSNSVRIEGNGAVVGQLFIADNHNIADSNGTMNLGRNGGTFENIIWNDVNDRFEISDELSLGLSEIEEVRIENLASAPVCDAGSRGRLYHNTTNDNSFVCDGTSFVQIDAGGGGGTNGWVDDGATVRLETITDNVGIGVNPPLVKLHVNGQGAFGNSVTTARVNSANGPRAFNVIDTNGVARVWRFTDSPDTDPAIEFVWGNNDDAANAANRWWDIYLNDDDQLRFRRRTGNNNTDYLSIAVDGDIGIKNITPSADLDIDSNSTNQPVIEINADNTNSRGDIHLSQRTTDASAPTEGDIWYNSADDNFRVNTSGLTSEVQIVEIAQVYESGTTTFNGSTPIDFDGTNASFRIIDSAFTHNIGTPSQIQVNADGIYEITYSISWDTDDNARRTSTCSIFVNGAALAVPVGRSHGYARNNTDDFETNSGTVILSLNDGDFYDIRCENTGTGGNIVTLANESSTIIKLLRRE